MSPTGSISSFLPIPHSVRYAKLAKESSVWRPTIRKVGVMGMGLMGGTIAQVAATKNFDTVVVDLSAEIIGTGVERIRDRLRALAAKLVRLKVDVSLPVAGDTRAVKEVTSTIPIVMAQTDDPVASGFVVSLARPGGNITGLSTLSPELSGKRLELLKEVVPKLSRVAVFGTSSSPGDAPMLNE